MDRGRGGLRLVARALFRALNICESAGKLVTARNPHGVSGVSCCWPGLGVVACVDRSEQYRRFAQECLEMARTSESEQTRVVLIQMAQVWFRLAEARASGDAKAARDPDPNKPAD